MKYLDILMVVLYLVALILIIVEFSGMWALASVLLIILIICSLQKSYFEGSYEKMKEHKNKIIEIITNKLDAFLNSIETVKSQIEQNSSKIENRLDEIQNFNREEINKTYRELTRKIVDVENKLNVVKRTLGAAYSVIDERLDKVESILNIKEEK